MKRIVTFSVEVSGETEEELRSNAKGIRDYTEEWMGRTGEWGNGYSAKIVSIGDVVPEEPEDDDDEEAEDAEAAARVAADYAAGAFIDVAFKEAPWDWRHFRVVRSEPTRLQVERTDHSETKIQRDQIGDIRPYEPVCAHGVNHWIERDCRECSVQIRNYLHGLMRRPT